MAVLKNLEDGTRHPLSSHVLVGRRKGCDLRLRDGRVSSEHASIAWRSGRWEVKDLGSRNGTFVNDRRISPGAWTPLPHEATVAFGGQDVLWELIDPAPPRPTAVALEGHAVVSDSAGVLCLPSEAFTDWLVCPEGDRWIATRENGETRTVSDGDVLLAGEQPFRLRLPDPQAATVDAGGPAVEEVILRFEVSRDEEHVMVTVLHGAGETILPEREHAYVLLTLARAWVEDGALPSEERGWRDREELLSMLRLDENHLNVAIFRARRQLAAAGIREASQVVQVRRHQRRIGVPVEVRPLSGCR